jgi:hypothetical protein
MAGNPVFQSTVYQNFKLVLDNIVDDDHDGIESSIDMPKYFDVGSMGDAYVDDLEMGGTGLAALKPEGSELAASEIKEGVKTRYTARTYGMKILISDEAKEDSKYPEVLKLAKRLKLSLYLTVDYDAAAVPARGWNSSYPGGDGVALFSSSHTLPNGGTWSNDMATPLSPSVQAIVVARAMSMKYPGHNGLIMGFDLKKVCFPTEQWGMWDGILGSAMDPAAGNFAKINVAKKLGIEPVAIKRWTNTTSNYFFITEAPDGLKWKWRRKPKSKTWVDNDQEIEKYGISARWARLWSDPRGVLGVQA